MLRVARPRGDARCLLRRVRQAVPHAPLIESHERRGRSRGAEHRPDGVRRVTMHAARCDAAHRPPDAAPYVVPQRHGPQKRLAARALALGNGQRRRHDLAPRMRERRGVRVVGLVRVSEHPVGERRVDGGRCHVGPHDGALGRSALVAGERHGQLPRLQLRARRHRGQRIEHVVLRLLLDLGRELPRQRAGYVGCKRFDQWGLSHIETPFTASTRGQTRIGALPPQFPRKSSPRLRDLCITRRGGSRSRPVGECRGKALCRGRGGVPHPKRCGWVGGKNSARPAVLQGLVCGGELERGPPRLPTFVSCGVGRQAHMRGSRSETRESMLLADESG